MADAANTTIRATPEDIASIALDFSALLTIAQTMHEEAWAFFKATKSPMIDAARPFTEALYYALGEMRVQASHLSDMSDQLANKEMAERRETAQ